MSAVMFLVVLPLPASAVTPAGNRSNWGVPATNASGTIERGGTITAVDFRNKTITVDGVIYSFLATSLKVYSDDPLVAGTPQNLQKNMRIRFNTTKDSYGGREVVVEIWITDPSRYPSQKTLPRKVHIIHD